MHQFFNQEVDAYNSALRPYCACCVDWRSRRTLGFSAISGLLTSGGLDNRELIKLVRAILLSRGVVSFLIRFAIYPISYGLVNKASRQAMQSLNDRRGFKENFVSTFCFCKVS